MQLKSFTVLILVSLMNLKSKLLVIVPTYRSMAIGWIGKWTTGHSEIF